MNTKHRKYEKDFMYPSSKRLKEEYYTKGGKGMTARRWTDEEIEMLFDMTFTDYELSILVEHSVHAIQNKRTQLRNEGHDIPYKSIIFGGRGGRKKGVKNE